MQLRSAALGGVVAAVLFLLAQSAYVRFNVGAARYDALFGAAATVPLLLVWIYVSMAIFLGFIASGISRTRSRCSMPFSSCAARTSMWSAS